VTETPTITATEIPYPFIITISAYNEAGELVRIVAQEKASAMLSSVILDVPGNSTAAMVANGNVLNIYVPGVETPLSLGMGGTTFTWDVTNAQAQFVTPGKYYIKIEEQDEYGHINVVIKDVLVVRIEQYIELKVFNSAGELVRTIRETNKPLPPAADLSAIGDLLIIEKNGAPVNIKYGTGATDYIQWDGKNEDGKVVSSGNYELQLSVKSETGAVTNAAKTVMLLREDKTFLADFSGMPSPYTADSGVDYITFKWSCKTAGETGYVYIRVYNVAGELVAQIRTKLEASSAIWDLQAGSDGHVSRGFYAAVITAKNKDGYTDVKTTKLAIISYP
jgi:flagellar hook assembly protein FlgD